MRAAMTALAVTAALTMIAVSTAMNFLFMKSLAETEAEGLVLGSASAAADILKACLPLFIALAWHNRRYLFAGTGSAMFLLFSAFSLCSAIGFAADVRGTLAGSRVEASRDLKRIEDELSHLARRRATLGDVRSPSEIAADLAGLRQDRRYQTSKACAEATLSTSREFCAGYFKVEAERARSEEAADLARRGGALEAEAKVLRDRGAGGEADPQVSVIARVLALDQGLVRNALIIAAALLVELGSGFGLWLALGHSDRASPSTPPNLVRNAEQGEGNKEATAPLDHGATEAPPRMGEVWAFADERVHPTAQGGMTITGLHRDYSAWCRDRGLVALEREPFATEFAALAEECGIAFDGDRFVGVRTGLPLEKL